MVYWKFLVNQKKLRYSGKILPAWAEKLWNCRENFGVFYKKISMENWFLTSFNQFSRVRRLLTNFFSLRFRIGEECFDRGVLRGVLSEQNESERTLYSLQCRSLKAIRIEMCDKGAWRLFDLKCAIKEPEGCIIVCFAIKEPAGYWN